MKRIIILFSFLNILILSLAAQEDTKVVTGQVVDAATNAPLFGAQVAAYGDARFTAMTDKEGHYQIKVPLYTRSVVIRLEGYNIQQKAIGN
jgi:hypothetical protein